MVFLVGSTKGPFFVSGGRLRPPQSRCRRRARALADGLSGYSCLCTELGRQSSETYTIERAALALERVNDIERRDRLALGVLRVRDRVADDALEEQLEDAARLVVDQPRDSLHAATTRETADGRLRNALNVVAQNLTVALRTALAQALASFSTCCEYRSRTSRHGSHGHRHRAALWRRALGARDAHVLGRPWLLCAGCSPACRACVPLCCVARRASEKAL